MEERRYDEACGKFDESQRLDPGGGTLLNLAVCYESAGRTASAWATFRKALHVAIQDARADRQSFAEQHLTALQPRLSRMRVVVRDEVRLPGLRILRNGIELREPAWQHSLPVDPGRHVIEVHAPGRRSLKVTVTVGTNGDVSTFVVPRLESIPSKSARAKKTRTTDPSDERQTRRLLSAMVVGAGVATAAIGTFFGVRAIRRSSEADERCPNPNRCEPNAFPLSEKAVSDGHLATVFVSSGLALMTTGSVLYLTARRSNYPGGVSASLMMRF
jgi:hypothetical protein